MAGVVLLAMLTACSNHNPTTTYTIGGTTYTESDDDLARWTCQKLPTGNWRASSAIQNDSSSERHYLVAALLVDDVTGIELARAEAEFTAPPRSRVVAPIMEVVPETHPDDAVGCEARLWVAPRIETREHPGSDSGLTALIVATLGGQRQQVAHLTR